MGAFDNAVLKANEGDAEDLRIGIAKSDIGHRRIHHRTFPRSIGVLLPCAFPVLPSYITYYLSLGMREEELHAEGKISGRSLVHSRSGLCRSRATDLFVSVGIVIFGLSEVVNLSGTLHTIAIGIACLLVVLVT